MKQTDQGLDLTTKRTCKREFLAQMEHVVPWTALVELVAPRVPESKKSRPPFAVEAMLRIHFVQHASEYFFKPPQVLQSTIFLLQIELNDFFKICYSSK